MIKLRVLCYPTRLYLRLYCVGGGRVLNTGAHEREFLVSLHREIAEPLLSAFIISTFTIQCGKWQHFTLVQVLYAKANKYVVKCYKIVYTALCKTFISNGESKKIYDMECLLCVVVVVQQKESLWPLVFPLVMLSTSATSGKSVIQEAYTSPLVH